MTGEDYSTLLGGPHCGRRLAPRTEAFLWISVDRSKSVRAARGPGAGVLYRSLDDAGRTYLYAADTYRRCEACEGIEPAGARCSFCGGRLLAA